MDNVQDFEIKDETSDGRLQYTLYCKGLARARLEEWQGRLYAQQMMLGPISVEEFMVYVHGVTELLLLAEGVADDYKRKKAERKKAAGEEGKARKRRRRRV